MKRFAVLFVTIWACSASVAADHIVVSAEIKAAWNASSSMASIGKNACVGDDFGCEQWGGAGAGNVSSQRGTEADEGAVLMLVAREIRTNGAKFCVTQVQIANRDRVHKICTNKQTGSVWTEYYAPVGSENGCFWLCKNGYYGDGCNTDDAPKSLADHEQREFSREYFKDFKRQTTEGGNIEYEIPMFVSSEWIGSAFNLHNGYESDTILAVTNWLPSGNGAWVAPVKVISTAHESYGTKRGCGWKDLVITSTPLLQAGIDQTLLCKKGYIHDLLGRDCVPYDANILDNQAPFCAGWESGYDAAIHELKLEERVRQVLDDGKPVTDGEGKPVTEDASCYKFRCSNLIHGFVSEEDRTCAECTGRAGLYGIADNGVCVTCSVGTVFNATKADKKYCVPVTHKFPQTVLHYGQNAGPTTKMADQCWTFTDDETYKACVLNGAAAAREKINKPSQ